MPFYEYQCQACGEQLEALQKMSEQPLVDCPACHKSALQKKISAAGFRLKGGGWYETDFKKDNKRNIAGSANEGSKTSSTVKTDKKVNKSAAKSSAVKDS